MSGDFEQSSSQYATVTVAHTSLNGATIFGWIIPESVTHATNEFLVLNISANATNVARMSLRIERTGGKLVLTCRRINADSPTSVTSATALSAGTTYFFAAVANYTGSRLDLYLVAAGGTLSAADASTTGISGWGSASDSNASAGAAIAGRADGAANNFYDGKIQELGFAQSALSLANLQAIYAGDYSGLTIRNRWKMDTTSGTIGTITDTQGNNNATAQASPVYAANFRVMQNTLSDTVSVSASETRKALRTLSDTVSVSTSLTRKALRTLSDTVSVSASLARSLSRSLSDTVSATPAAARKVLRSLSDTVSASASFSYVNIVLMTLSATVSVSASLARRVAKRLSGTVSAAPTLARKLFRALGDTVSATPALARKLFRTLGDTVSVSASLRRLVKLAWTAVLTLVGSQSQSTSLIPRVTIARFAGEVIPDISATAQTVPDVAFSGQLHEV